MFKSYINGSVPLEKTAGAIDKEDGSIEYHFTQVTIAIQLATKMVSMRNSGASGSKTPYLTFSLESCREALDYKRSSPRTDSPHRAPYQRLPERITTEKPSYDQDDSMQ